MKYQLAVQCFLNASRAKAKNALVLDLRPYVHENKYDVICIANITTANWFWDILERLILNIKGNFIFRNVWCFNLNKH